jgi:hypothetical protein
MCVRAPGAPRFLCVEFCAAVVVVCVSERGWCAPRQRDAVFTRDGRLGVGRPTCLPPPPTPGVCVFGWVRCTAGAWKWEECRGWRGFFLLTVARARPTAPLSHRAGLPLRGSCPPLRTHF